MRWRRSCKRLMILLLFVCMTVKIHLEFRLLDATKSDNSFSPWWSNETLGHLRGYPKNAKFPSSPRGQSPPKGAASSSPKYVQIGNESVRIIEPGNIKVLPDASLSLKKNIGNLSLNISNKNASAHTQQSLTNAKRLVDDKAKETQNNKNAKSPARPTESQDPRVAKHMFAMLSQIYSNRKLANKKNDSENPDVNNQQKVPKKVEPVAKPKEPAKPKPATEIAKPKPKPKPKASPRKTNVVKKGVSHDVDPEEVSLKQEDIFNIKKKLEVLNQEQTIHNEQRYGPVLANTTILLVQVHNRLENLRYLVESMTKTRGINETLVILSHDYWYPAMNDFVTNITEFRVMQIFFPFSIQLHPLAFPGRDPRDCTWNTNSRTGGLKCLNREWPDTYGHYREASFTQIKHHWWWKIHRVFHGLRATANFTGHVIFLEEDHYILPDLLYVFSLMKQERKKHCPNCQVLALGNYNKMSPAVYKNFIERGDWWVTKHNLGFALDMAAWKSLSKCKVQFCEFDDYNWDWTLNNIIQTCFKPRMSMLSIKFSRVIHVGSCGTHVKKRSCDVAKEVQTARNRITTGKPYLFPTGLSMQNVYRGSGRVKKGNGGWGDFRDRQLCQAIWNGTASEGTLRRLEFPEFAKKL